MKCKYSRMVIGYYKSLISKYTPLKFSSSSIEGIYNYLQISDKISSSGQPTIDEFVLIKNEGFKVVINLIPDGTENSLKEEKKIVTELGMEYYSIPVQPWSPTKKNFETFVEIMERNKDENIWIHCAANARVSGFIYKYRCEILREDKSEALHDLNKIWNPKGVWKEFVFGN